MEPKENFLDLRLGIGQHYSAAQVSNNGKTAPVENGNVDAPAENGNVDAPAKNGDFNAPAENGNVDAPAENGNVDAPAENGNVDAPAENGNVDAPAENGNVHAPAENEEYPYNEDDLPAQGRRKFQPTPKQLELLVTAFELHSSPTTDQKNELADKTGLTYRRVEVWFQNRRARGKQKKTESTNAVLQQRIDELEAHMKELTADETGNKELIAKLSSLKQENEDLRRRLLEIGSLARVEPLPALGPGDEADPRQCLRENDVRSPEPIPLLLDSTGSQDLNPKPYLRESDTRLHESVLLAPDALRSIDSNGAELRETTQERNCQLKRRSSEEAEEEIRAVRGRGRARGSSSERGKKAAKLDPP